MKNKNTKAGKAFNFGFILLSGFMLMLAGISSSVFAALRVESHNAWNGSAELVEAGNNIQVVPSASNGFKGEIIIKSDQTVEKLDVSSVSSIFQGWVDSDKLGCKLQVNGDVIKDTYCIAYDKDSKSIVVGKGSCGGWIVATPGEVCKGGEVVLSIEGGDDYSSLRWGVVDTDTIWMSADDDKETVTYTVDKDTKYVLEYTSASGIATVSQASVKTSLKACGYTLTPSDISICPGQEVTITSSYTGGKSYVWKDKSGMTVQTTTEPTVSLNPTSKGFYTLYVDGEYAGRTNVDLGACDLFITAYFPTSTCLQTSNYLDLVSEETKINNDAVVSWEVSENGDSWSAIAGETSTRLPVYPTSDLYYRAKCNGVYTPAFFYKMPDCNKNENCNELQTRVLFYETFGYFLNKNTYVSNKQVYQNDITIKGTVSAWNRNDGSLLGYAGNMANSDTDYMERIEQGEGYYKARAESDSLRLSNHGSTTYHIDNFVAPDPTGCVVQASQFVRLTEKKDGSEVASNTNQFVGTNGHLFLGANPMLPTYTWTDNPAYRLQDGYYAIVANPDSLDRNKHSDYLDCTDATGNVNGAMLFVNSGKTDISKSAIYAQRVELGCSADRFSFGMNIRNAAKKAGLNPVNISVLLLEDISEELPEEYRKMDDVNPQHVLNDEIVSGDVESGSIEWTRIDKYVELGGNRKVESLWVVLFNNGEAGDGNDILLDDISFSVCLPKAELSASIGDELITGEVKVCDGSDLTLVASQKGDYIKNPVYLFQYQDQNTNQWTDMKEYSSDASLYQETTTMISAVDERFAGDVRYRVIIGSSVDELRQVASNPTDICNEFLVAESDIKVTNLYGGPMCEDRDVPFCFVEGDTMMVTGCRTLTKPTTHEWKMLWKNSKGEILVDTTDAIGVNSDNLYIVVKEKGAVSILDRNQKETYETDFNGISQLTFEAIDAEECVHEQQFSMKPKHVVNLSFDADSVVGCDSVDVTVSKDVDAAKLNWVWSVGGTEEFVSESERVFYPNGLSETAFVEGDVKISVADDGDDFCAPAKPLSIPFKVYNVSYGFEIVPSSSPVCVTAGQADDAKLLTLTVVTTPKLAISNISQFNWILKFEKGDEVKRSTSGSELVLTYADLHHRTGQQLSAYLESTETVECGEIKYDTIGSSTKIDIREGGFALTLEPESSSVCLTSVDSFNLTARVAPFTAMTSIKKLTFSDAFEDIREVITNPNDSAYTITIKEKDFPDVFKAGVTQNYKVSAFDQYCLADNMSNIASVDLNGYTVKLVDPDMDGKECLSLGESLAMTANFDDTNAAKFIKSYEWYKDDVKMGSTTSSSFDFPVTESSTSEYKLVVSDGICSDQSDSVDIAVSVKYTVNVSADQQTVCQASDSAVVRATIEPASSMFQIKRFEWHAVIDGKDTVLLNGGQNDSVLVLNSERFPWMIKAGVSAEIYAIADDGICEVSVSEGKVRFDFNSDYKMKIDWNEANSVCVSSEADVEESEVLLSVDVKIEPADALKQIKEFIWHIKGDQETSWTAFSTKTNHLELTYADLKKYRGQDIKLYVSSYDEICTDRKDPDLSDTVTVKIRVGGFTIDLDPLPNGVCVTDLEDTKLTLRAHTDPSEAKYNLSEYYWYDGDGLIATTKEDSLVLMAKDYEKIFAAGYTAKFRVSAFDEACSKEVVNSDNETNVDFNTEYTMTVDWDPASSVCVSSSDNVNPDLVLLKVDVKISPENAINHIKKFIWHIKGNQESSWTDFPTDNNRLELTFEDLKKYRGQDILLYVSSYDEICTTPNNPDLSDTVTVKIRVGGFSLELAPLDEGYCVTELTNAKLTLKAIVSPEEAKENISEYFWYDDKELLAKTSADFIEINAKDYEKVFAAGHTAHFIVAAFDESCSLDTIFSKTDAKVEFNVPFEVYASISNKNVCLPVTEEVTITAKTNPENAINHIKKYVWTRLKPSEIVMETTEPTVNVANWLEVADTLAFSLKVFDDVCYDSATGNGAMTNDTMHVNKNFTPILSTDKSFVCSENSSFVLTTALDPSESYGHVYEYKMKFNGNESVVGLGNENGKMMEKQTIMSNMLPKEGIKPGDKIGFYVKVNDGDVCGPVASNEIQITIQTPFDIHMDVTPKEICVHTNSNIQVKSITPQQAEQFITKYRWYQIREGMDSMMADVSGKVFTSTDIKPGENAYFVRAVDGICYDETKPRVSDTTTIVVNDSLRASFFPSSTTFCNPVDGSINLTVTTTTGSPTRFQLYDGKTGALLSDVQTTRATCTWEGYKPTVENNSYFVKIYDGICSVDDATSIKVATKINVHVPVEFSVVPAASDICEGDTVRLAVLTSKGTPSVYHVSGFVDGNEQTFETSNFMIFDAATVPGMSDYEIYADDSICPSTDVQTVSINVHEQPQIEMLTNKEEVVIGGDIEFTANILKGEPIVYEWLCDGVSIGQTEENVLTYLPKSTSHYTVYASDPVCPAVYSEMDLKVKLPTAFTPFYRDGLNDTFMRGFEVIIFDRYGQKVFEGNDGWDGTRASNGANADPGVYFYKVVLKDGKTEKGTVEVTKID